MPPDADIYAFDKFPRGYLNFTVSRRQFLPTLIQNFLAISENGYGKPALKLNELGIRSNEEIAQIYPRVVPGCIITVLEDMVWGQPPRDPRPIKLFPLHSPALTAFNLFNATTAIEVAVSKVAEKTGWARDRSFAYVRGLFLWLVLTRVCQPAHQ
jgi:hypothetical protein